VTAFKEWHFPFIRKRKKFGGSLGSDLLLLIIAAGKKKSNID
jgi:hypothetical protein